MTESNNDSAEIPARSIRYCSECRIRFSNSESIYRARTMCTPHTWKYSVACMSALERIVGTGKRPEKGEYLGMFRGKGCEAMDIVACDGVSK